MATTISKCNSCGYSGCHNFCVAIGCKIHLVRKYGEVLNFGNGVLKFSPKIMSSLQPIIFYDKSFDMVINFLYPTLLEIDHRGVK